MAIAFVQSWATNSSASSTTLLAAYQTNCTAGNLLVCGVSAFGGTTYAVSDSQGNTWLPAAAQFSTEVQIFYCAHCLSSAANTVTFTVSPAKTFLAMAILEYSGLPGTVFVDKTATGTGSGTNAVVSAGFTTTVANEVIVAVCITTSTVTAAGSGYNIREIARMGGNGCEDRILTSTGTFTPNFTQTTGTYFVQAVSFASSNTPGVDSWMPLASIRPPDKPGMVASGGQ